MSTSNSLMLLVVARLADAAVIDNVSNIRRDHRTVVSREHTPRVHVVDGNEEPTPPKGCRCEVAFAFTVSIFVRDDAGFSAADPIVIAVMAALDPATGYGDGIELLRGRVVRDQEIEDADSLQTDMEFTFKYTTGEWEL